MNKERKPGFVASVVSRARAHPLPVPSPKTSSHVQKDCVPASLCTPLPHKLLSIAYHFMESSREIQIIDQQFYEAEDGRPVSFMCMRLEYIQATPVISSLEEGKNGSASTTLARSNLLTTNNSAIGHQCGTIEGVGEEGFSSAIAVRLMRPERRKINSSIETYTKPSPAGPIANHLNVLPISMEVKSPASLKSAQALGPQ